MSALKKLTSKTPFGLKQHVRVADFQGIGNPNQNWNWVPTTGKHSIDFSDATASQRTRTNTNGIADSGEYY